MTNPKSPQNDGGSQNKRFNFLKLAAYVITLFGIFSVFPRQVRAVNRENPFHPPVAQVAEIGRPSSPRHVFSSLGRPCRVVPNSTCPLGSFEYFSRVYPNAPPELINQQVASFDAGVRQSAQDQQPIREREEQPVREREGQPVREREAPHPTSREARIARRTGESSTTQVRMTLARRRPWLAPQYDRIPLFSSSSSSATSSDGEEDLTPQEVLICMDRNESFEGELTRDKLERQSYYLENMRQKSADLIFKLSTHPSWRWEPGSREFLTEQSSAVSGKRLYRLIEFDSKLQTRIENREYFEKNLTVHPDIPYEYKRYKKTYKRAYKQLTREWRRVQGRI